MQRALVLAGGDLGVRPFRLGHREVVQERDDVVQFRVVAVQPRQVHLCQFDRAHLPRANELGQMTDRPERRVLEGGGALQGRRGAETERQLRFVDLEARYECAEVKGRRHVVWNVDRALFFVAREVLVRGIDHRLELCVTEFQAGELHRVGDHGQRDSFLARVLHAGPENARRKRRAQTEACKVRDESSARFIQVGHVDPRECMLVACGAH